MKTTPYHINIPEKEVADLYYRLNNTRYPAEMAGNGWEEGMDLNYMRTLADYWANIYNWREREAFLNTFNHNIAEIDGIKIHYLHQKSADKNAVPLLLMQGWPSSFIQALDIIPLLTTPSGNEHISFNVVAVSLPGYAFSEIPSERGINFLKIADLSVELMTNILGYTRFAARGSDQGALVQQQIGLKYPEKLIGIHRSGITPFLNPLPDDLSDEEKVYQDKVKVWALKETSYANLHAFRPETILPALVDSPVGLATWIMEKFRRWGGCSENPDQYYGRDRLLDNICLHWFTSGGAGAIRLYNEALRNPGLSGRVEVPTAIAMPLKDAVTIPAPRRWAERFYNVRQWTLMETSGHFPEWEIPHILTEDIRKFFSSLLIK